MQKNITMVAAFMLVFALGAGAMKLYHDRMDDDVFNADDVFSDEHDFSQDSIFDDIFNDDFFARSRSPFEEMHRMQKRMDEMFDRQQRMPNFEKWFDRSYGEFPAQSISVIEDNNSLAYVLDVGDSEVGNVAVEVADGYVSIEAQLEKKSASMNATSVIKQRFPVPANVDADSVKVEQKDDRVFVRFRKLET